MEELKSSINKLEDLNKDNYVEILRVLYDKLNNDTKTEMNKKQKETLKKYYQNNKEHLLEKQKEYNRNHKEEIKEKQKKYREKRKEEMKPIIEARKKERQAEREAIRQEKLKNKRPVGRPRKPDNELKTPRKQPKIIQDENSEEIQPKQELNEDSIEIKPKRGRPKRC